MDKELGTSLGTRSVADDTLGDEHFLALKFDVWSGVLELVWVARGVRPQERDVEDRVDLKCGWQIQPDRDGREPFGNSEWAEVASVQLLGRSRGLDVLGTQPNEVADVKDKRVVLLVVIVKVGRALDVSVIVLSLQLLSVEDVLTDGSVDLFETGDCCQGGRVMRRRERKVGHGDGVVALVGKERRVFGCGRDRVVVRELG